MNRPVVQCAGVTRYYGDILAVDNVSFDLAPGEVLSILGPSGCGKTTLLRLIAGFETPGGGQISIQGELVSAGSVHVPSDRRNVGMVFQEYALFPHMTVAQNVSFGLHRLARRERQRRLAEVTDMVRLTGLEARYPHELSGGQQQRVALARTVAPRPVAVLLDEPFSNLDAGMRSEMRQEVASILREHDIATVFVTHDREEAFAMADRIGVMRDGHLEQLDSPEVVYDSPATPFVTRLAGMCDLLRGEMRGGRAITEIGALPCHDRENALAEGSQVDLLVRPDDFQVVAHPSGGAVIKSREFRGDGTILVVETPSGVSVRCRQPSHPELIPGTRVDLVPRGESPFVAFCDLKEEI